MTSASRTSSHPGSQDFARALVGAAAGANTTAPVDVFGSNATSTASTSHVAPTVTTTVWGLSDLRCNWLGLTGLAPGALSANGLASGARRVDRTRSDECGRSGTVVP